MSWLGVNLNDSINSIKGQISNITKEILADEDGLEDRNIEVLIPKKKLKELETSKMMLEEEVRSMKNEKSELGDRFHAIEYNYQQKLTSLEKQLSTTQEELRIYQEKSSGWDWGAEGGIDSQSSIPHSKRGTSSNENEIAHLRQESQRGQEDLATWQIGTKTTSTNKVSDAVSELQNEIQFYQNELTSLREENSKFQAHNDEFNSNLIDLDSQHQLVIDELLKSKNNLASQLKYLEEECSRLNSLASETDRSVLEKQIQNLTRENISLRQSLDDLLAGTCPQEDEGASNRSQQDEAPGSLLETDGSAEAGRSVDIKKLESESELLQEKLQSKDVEIDRLSCRVEELETSLEKLQSISSSSDNHLETSRQTVKQLEQDNEILKQQLSSLETEQEECLLKHQQEMETLKQQLSAFETQSERDSQHHQETQLLRQQLSSLESHHQNDKQLLSSKEDQITFLKEEILKFEAVIEERESIQTKLHEKLQRHEKIAKDAIGELQNKLKNLEEANQDLKTKLEGSSIPNNDQIKKDKVISQLLQRFDIQDVEQLNDSFRDVERELASLRCERDQLALQLTSTSQELKDVQDMIDALEAEKIDLEKETEDLRDQLEELQCGERPTPEGSLNQRSLPTIEEEESDIQQSSPVSSQEEPSSTKTDLENQSSSSSQDERINYLQSQINALTEARQNLEMELARVNAEKEEIHSQYTSVNSQLGNLSNLEVEAAALRNEKDQLQKLLEKKSDDANLDSDLHKRIQKMTESMKTLNMKASAKQDEFQEEKKELMKRINDQNQIIDDSKSKLSLLQSLQVELQRLSEEKVQNEEKQLNLEAELNKANCAIIYKDDHIDQLKQGMQLIGQIYDLNDVGLRQLYVTIKQKHHNLLSQLKSTTEEIETLKEELEGEKNVEKNTELKVNLESARNKLRETEAELEKLKEIDSTKLNETERDLCQLTTRNEDLVKEKTQLEAQLSDLQLLLKNKESQLTILEDDKKVLENTVEEKIAFIHSLQNQSDNQVIEHNLTLDSLEKQHQANVEQIHKSHLQKLEEQETLIQSMKKIQNEESDGNELLTLRNDLTTSKSQYEELEKEKNNLNQKLENYESEIKSKIDDYEAKLKSKEIEMNTLQESLANAKLENDKLNENQENILQKLSAVQSEAEQWKQASQQKHQESLNYYHEIQRVNELFQKEIEKRASEIENLKFQLQDAEQEKKMLSHSLTQFKQDTLQKDQADILTQELKRKKEEINRLTEEMKNLQELSDVAIRERDHLRVANASFNAQYEEKCKELNAVSEKEKHASLEVSRLKQHLVDIEETYTAEAVKSKDREDDLRKSLANVREKVASQSTFITNAKQKTEAHVEATQEKLSETLKRNEELEERLQALEDTCQQQQESLKRLQQVLQDFQKTQSRDVTMATERERRKVDEERQKCALLENQILSMKEKLDDADDAAKTCQDLRQQVITKEDTIVALKSQVNAVQLAAKKNQDQIMALQTKEEGKVDKNLVRNLMVGYFATPFDKRPEVLRVIAQVLDFSSEERSRSGLDVTPGSWLTSIGNFLAPPPSNVRVTSKVDLLDHSSLSQAFIRFLEEESTPVSLPRLPAVEMAEETQKKAQQKAKSTISTTANSSMEVSSHSKPEIPINPLLSTSVLPDSFPVLSTPTVLPSTSSTTPPNPSSAPSNHANFSSTSDSSHFVSSSALSSNISTPSLTSSLSNIPSNPSDITPSPSNSSNIPSNSSNVPSTPSDLPSNSSNIPSNPSSDSSINTLYTSSNTSTSKFLSNLLQTSPNENMSHSQNN